ncbi:hypothetical protein DUNSADRAFT_17054 [Dunaliella salina]|uniref:Encoded protein n=1 Tax=Dunaliella salina TaxID=3046 RepID=A0ABQ7H0H7_DUNSA|nr:hypothetical protein DUNSADRAFT_17054 [Dunaliella salina]|eukprot:KAF5840357.1 hypothetical protein DUNSADRAFT_17054 [Dunaliella salina]
MACAPVSLALCKFPWLVLLCLYIFYGFPWLAFLCLLCCVGSHGLRSCVFLYCLGFYGSCSCVSCAVEVPMACAPVSLVPFGFSWLAVAQPRRRPLPLPLSMPPAHHQPAEQPLRTTPVRSNSMGRRPSPIAKLTMLANRLRASMWLRGVNGKVVEAGEDGRYLPLLQHPRASFSKACSIVQQQHHSHLHSHHNQLQQRREREGLKLPVSNVTSNPLGEEADLDEPFEDSSAAPPCDWERNISDQPHHHNQHENGKGREHKVPQPGTRNQQSVKFNSSGLEW